MNEIYEQQKVLGEYLLFHYGIKEEILSEDIVWPSGMIEALDFARRTPEHFSKSGVSRGLDLGCAVGRSTFEMANRCEEVLGMDYSHKFIEAAEILREGKGISYHRLDEGHISTELYAEAPEKTLRDRVRFFQGDAMNLPSDLGSFDLVHGANLLCRLRTPSILLKRFPDLVKSGGELILATPCTWLEEFTPAQEWPTEDTLSWLKGHLESEFDLVKTCDEPFLIRETSRKFQWSRSMVSLWRKK